MMKKRTMMPPIQIAAIFPLVRPRNIQRQIVFILHLISSAFVRHTQNQFFCFFLKEPFIIYLAQRVTELSKSIITQLVTIADIS